MSLFGSFYFDCDSTLSQIEGVDELVTGEDPALREELQRMTDDAMNGTLPLQTIFKERLQRIAPSRTQLERVGQAYIDNAVADAQDTIAALRFLGKGVGVVSGGLLPAVMVLAQHLGIDAENVHAVPIFFDDDGNYAGYDEDCPLSRNQGKPEFFRELSEKLRPVLFLGDGITDLETTGTVDLFVGFGGVVRRVQVEEEAKVFLTKPTLASVLEVGLTPQEQDQLRSEPRFAKLL